MLKPSAYAIRLPLIFAELAVGAVLLACLSQYALRVRALMLQMCADVGWHEGSLMCCENLGAVLGIDPCMT